MCWSFLGHVESLSQRMNFEEFCLPLSGDPKPGCLIVNKRIPEPGCPGLEFTSTRKLRARDGLAGGDRGGTSRYVQSRLAHLYGPPRKRQFLALSSDESSSDACMYVICDTIGQGMNRVVFGWSSQLELVSTAVKLDRPLVTVSNNNDSHCLCCWQDPSSSSLVG